MATARTSAAPVNRIPSARTSRSFSFGITMITSAPTIGSSVVIVMAEFSHPSSNPRSPFRRASMKTIASTSDAHEQDRRVPLDVAGLDVLQERRRWRRRCRRRRSPRRRSRRGRTRSTTCARPRAAAAAPFTMASSTFWLNQYTPADTRVAHRVDDALHVERVDVVAVLEHVPRAARARLQRIASPGRSVERVAHAVTMPPSAATVPTQRDPRHEVQRLGIASKNTHLTNDARRAAARPGTRRSRSRSARTTSGPAMRGGDSCGCAVAPYVPKNVMQHHARRVEGREHRGDEQ